MSPEQVRMKDDLDIRSDIYALGVILFTMLSGKHPHRGKNHQRPDEEHRVKRGERPRTCLPRSSRRCL